MTFQQEAQTLHHKTALSLKMSIACMAEMIYQGHNNGNGSCARNNGFTFTLPSPVGIWAEVDSSTGERIKERTFLRKMIFREGDILFTDTDYDTISLNDIVNDSLDDALALQAALMEILRDGFVHKDNRYTVLGAEDITVFLLNGDGDVDEYPARSIMEAIKIIDNHTN